MSSDALKRRIHLLTFDDEAGTGGSRRFEDATWCDRNCTALEKALQNADLGFDHKAGLLR